MSSESEEKTEDPTSKRIKDAREEGTVAKSQEVNTFMQLLILLIWGSFSIRELVIEYGSFFQVIWRSFNDPAAIATENIFHIIGDMLWKFLFLPSVILILGLFMVSVMQVGFVLSPKSIIPKLDKINPLNTLKQMFGMSKLLEFGLMVIRMTTIGVVFYYLLVHYAATFAVLPLTNVFTGFYVLGKMIEWMMQTLVIISLVFGALDYLVKKRQVQKQLMMSMDEIKKEFKETEGNQEVKNKMREMAQEVQSGSLSDSVGNSSFMLKNPTHLAVCVRYVPGETVLPKMLDYGYGYRALNMLKRAHNLNIPVIENVALAHNMVASIKPGDYIPEHLFREIAVILRTLELQQDQHDLQTGIKVPPINEESTIPPEQSQLPLQ